MSKRNPKTNGTEWLYLSMASFNGSGYADKSSATAYLESYIYYKAWRKDVKAVDLAKKFSIEALSFAEKLINANEAGHTPSQKHYNSFLAFKERAGLLL